MVYSGLDKTLCTHTRKRWKLPLMLEMEKLKRRVPLAKGRRLFQTNPSRKSKWTRSLPSQLLFCDVHLPLILMHALLHSFYLYFLKKRFWYLHDHTELYVHIYTYPEWCTYILLWTQGVNWYTRKWERAGPQLNFSCIYILGHVHLAHNKGLPSHQRPFLQSCETKSRTESLGSKLGGLPTIPVLAIYIYMNHAQIHMNGFHWTQDTLWMSQINCACVPHNMQENKIGRGIENVTENRDVFNAVSVTYTHKKFYVWNNNILISNILHTAVVWNWSDTPLSYQLGFYKTYMTTTTVDSRLNCTKDTQLSVQYYTWVV